MADTIGCCDPFGKPHGHPKRQKGVRLITDQLIQRGQAILPNFDWNATNFLCLNCRLRIERDYKNFVYLKAGLTTVFQRVNVEHGASGQAAGDAPPTQDVLPTEQAGSSSCQATSPAAKVASTSKQVISDTEDDPISVFEEITEPPNTQINQSMPKQESPKPYSEASEFTPPSKKSKPSHQPLSGTKPSTSTSSQPIPGPSMSTLSTTSSLELTEALHDLNKTLEATDVTPVRPCDSKKPGILHRTYFSAKRGVARQLAKFSKTKMTLSPTVKPNRPCFYCDTNLTELADKFKTADTRADKYKILTSIPKRFGITTIIGKTGCTTYEGRIASALRSEQGAYSYPPPIMGRPLQQETVDFVIKYYLSDNNTRASPNKRDVINVRESDGSKVLKEKRYILHNANDIYSAFKQEYPEVSISVSKFMQLRPKHCVWPGRNLQHVVCVCEIHENFRFLLQATGSKLKISEFVSKVVCGNDECYLGLCDSCPKQDVLDELFAEISQDSEVTFMQWDHTDSTEIKKITIGFDRFKQLFLQQIPKIVEHEFINKRQAEYVENVKKVILKQKSALLIQVDFAQNYAFVIQNAVQGFHWSNKTATVHPFVVHWIDQAEDTLKYRTYCVISDELGHDADTFHAFRQQVIATIKKDFGQFPVEKIYYVSDGAGSQYKNFKNFANLMNHEADFGIKAQWVFTATSHGKSTCDAISAVVKCSVRRASLKPNTYITNADEMFQFCQNKLTSDTLKFEFVSKNTVAATRVSLTERYKRYKKIDGTRSHHIFEPLNDSVIRITRCANTNQSAELDIKRGETTDFSYNNLEKGSYYAFRAANTYQIGSLLDVSTEQGDASFQTFKLNRKTGVALWPEPLVFLHVAYRDILIKVEEPTPNENDDGYTIRKDKLTQIKEANQHYLSKQT